MSFTDPLGLFRSDNVGTEQENRDFANSSTWIVNGAQVSGTVAQSLLGMDAATMCPASGCGSGSLQLGSQGQWQTFVQSSDPNPPCTSGATICTGIQGTWLNYNFNSGQGNLFAQGPGQLPPGANGTLQAMKQATRGVPKTSPNPNSTPGNWKAPEDIEDYMSQESKAIKYVLDNWDPSTGGTVILTIDPKLFDPVQRYCMLYPCGT